MKSFVRNPIMVLTDFEIKRQVFSHWRGGINQEASTITACICSRLQVANSKQVQRHVKQRLVSMVWGGDIRRIKFLKGRPAYTI